MTRIMWFYFLIRFSFSRIFSHFCWNCFIFIHYFLISIETVSIQFLPLKWKKNTPKKLVLGWLNGWILLSIAFLSCVAVLQIFTCGCIIFNSPFLRGWLFGLWLFCAYIIVRRKWLSDHCKDLNLWIIN